MSRNRWFLDALHQYGKTVANRPPEILGISPRCATNCRNCAKAGVCFPVTGGLKLHEFPARTEGVKTERH